ncbi:MAG: response regulator [Burkholderiaceae bacterium]|nr:response regulator [Burkholderiaceae bacterium]
MRVLLVEDDRMIGQAVQTALRQDGYAVDWVRDAETADTALSTADFDLVLLDLGLPDGDGLQWLGTLRAAGCRTPVLILSARDRLDERVQGLDSGADDYLVKPFEAEELLARIRALLRRGSGGAQPLIEAGALSYDPETQQFHLDDLPLGLSPQERSLLAVLIRAAGRTVSRERLLLQLYGLGEGVDSNTLEVRIHGLRRQLGKERIETVRGLGYRLVPL